MKLKIFILTLLAVLTFLTALQTAFAQPLQTGQAVMTFYHQDGYSVSVIDTRLRPPFSGVTWNAAPFSYNPSWGSGAIGTVFGIAIDNSKNIFIGSAAVYNETSPEFGPAGPGSVYVLDGCNMEFNHIY
jgi:hypothetical protein